LNGDIQVIWLGIFDWWPTKMEKGTGSEEDESGDSDADDIVDLERKESLQNCSFHVAKGFVGGKMLSAGGPGAFGDGVVNLVRDLAIRFIGEDGSEKRSDTVKSKCPEGSLLVPAETPCCLRTDCRGYCVLVIRTIGDTPWPTVPLTKTGLNFRL
jgi:hypothetical protein